MDYYSGLKMLEILSHAAPWLNLEDSMLNEATRYKKTNTVCFTYLGHLKKSRLWRQSRMVTAKGEGKGETGSYYLGGWSSRFAR